MAALMLVAVAALGVSRTAHAKAQQYDISPAPPWVQPATVEDRGRLTPNLKDGTAYLLSDRQIRIQNGWSEYQRYVTRVVNPAGVQDASQITIDFDPKLDHLILNSVQVRRGKQVIDELRHGRIEVLQRESALEQDILDGSLTFHLLMSDVRVGDTIDESYTIQHHDPALGDRFFERLTTRWDEPVERSRLRVWVPGMEPLSVGGTEPSAPARYRKGGWRILEWNWNALPATVTDDDAPSWYEQHPAIQLSQFTDWGEVVKTTLPLFSFDPRDRDLAAIAEHLKSSATTPSGQALEVVRFVQEKVRYTGLELGSGAFRPRPPGEVLRSRYGDCKDKTLLAVALLRALGFDAAPALVSTRWDGHLDEQLPSPGDFDHAIVRLRLAGKTYWIDVTETAQGGVLETLDQADFGKALVILPGVAVLEAMPREIAARPLVAATSLFDLRAGMDAEGSYNVSTVYRGANADSMRRRLRRSTPSELGEQYLNYYKGRYPGFRAVGPPVIQDDPVANEITVNEAYRIAHPFEVRKPGLRRFEVDTETLDDYVQSTSHPAREAPLSIDYPVYVTQQITIRLPSYFPIKTDTVNIDHATFHYGSRVTHSGNDVTFEANYRTLADEVPRDQLEGFLTKVDEVRQDDSLTFTSHDPTPTSGKASRTLLTRGKLSPADQVVAKALALARVRHITGADSEVSVPPIVTIALSFVFAIWCGWRVFAYDPTPEKAEANAPSGIRGFLVLPAIGVIFGPIVYLGALKGWVKLSDSRVWRMLPWIDATSYQSWRHYAYLALLAAICVQLVGSVVNVALFFKKRSSAPMVLVVFWWFGWLVTLGLGLFNALLGTHDHSFMRPVGIASEQLFFLGAWSLYMFGSQRVKATFVSRRPTRPAVYVESDANRI